MPGTGGAFTASTAVTTMEVGPLTSSPSSRGQRWGGALWRPVLARRMYLCTTAASGHAYVQCTVLRYLSCLLYRNKLVLS
jgi:hypothetical protein